MRTPNPFARALTLIGASAILLLLCFVALIMAGDRLENAYRQQHQSYLLADEFRQASDDLTRTARSYVVTGDVRFKNEYQTIADILDGKAPRPQQPERIYWPFIEAGGGKPRPDGPAAPLLDLMKQAGFSAEELAKLDEAKKASDALIKLEEEAMQLAAGGPEEQARARELVHGHAYHAEVARIMQPVDAFFELLKTRSDAAVEQAAAIEQGLSVLTAVLAALLFTALWYAKRTLDRQIGGSVDLAHRAIGAFAGGDFSQAVPYRGEQSILGQLESMRRALSGTLQAIRAQSTEVADAAERMNEAARAVEASSAKQADAAGSMESGMQQVSASINEVARSAGRVDEQSRKTREVSEHGADIIASTVAEIENIARAVETAASSVDELGRKGSEIVHIVQVIKDVADQTNLLALNAAIEAARAGEQGRGFAVVADEVRKLAERSALAAQDIASRIDEIGRGTQNSVEDMQQVSTRVATGVQLAREAGESMQTIRTHSIELAGETAQIARAIEEHVGANAHIDGHVQHIGVIAEENRHSAGDAADVAGRMSTLAETMNARLTHFTV
ncbi:methyl-accepting chemotaxis protein [Crenobacter caeni]|uniref:Methyl-accepting chemotaxis protein n=1 Tax=Crenobacter caeni TaxID=2705474 RepID=A0A6B2KSX1_9NEIS|nr:methyl-accepting chemotaxis protein [Crenobacter caeni]NDV13057.1 methyl-accepting chemotaxis protein [Crenobacter caeni]